MLVRLFYDHHPATTYLLRSLCNFAVSTPYFLHCGDALCLEVPWNFNVLALQEGSSKWGPVEPSSGEPFKIV